MASDQTLPLPPLPAPSNPNQIHTTPTAPLPGDDSPTPPPTSSAARKLPIKRRSPPRPSASPTSSGANPASPNPAFKFQRIWSETDELRFLQGLLGCGAQGQGLAFPRDLNVFYDQFSESMPQPYTRSQLSEKLRRLKKKYRVCAKRMLAQGGTFAFRSAHEGAIYDVARHIWRPAFKPDGSDEDDINPAEEADEGGGGNTSAHTPRGRGSRRGRRRTAQEMETPSMPATPAAAILVTDSIAQEPAVVALESSVPPIAPPPPLPAPVTANGPTEDDFRSILSPLLKELISSITVAGQTELGSGLGMGFGRVSGTDILGLRFGVAGLNPVAPSGDKWKQQQILELEVYLKRIELVREQVTTVLQELRPSQG
jgi:hypothetical protein